MSFHIMMPTKLNLEPDTALRPRHAIQILSRELNATIHQPTRRHTHGDRLRSKIFPTGDLWALARNVKSQTSDEDVIFCPSEAGGLHLAALYNKKERCPKIAVFAHNLDRPRTRLALRFWQMQNAIDLWLACSEYQVGFLRKYLSLPDSRVQHIYDHIDNEFFTPGPASPRKTRPLIVSVGLEQRDYRTLALATSDLDVDVRISGFSKDARSNSKSLPHPLPHNMFMQFYEWPDLVQLYRDADVVVVSCFQNKYAAGVQSLMEAASCSRPIVVTSTQGLKSYIDGSMIAVEPTNPTAMRNAIIQLLDDKESAEIRATHSHKLAATFFDMDRYVSDVALALRSLNCR